MMPLAGPVAKGVFIQGQSRAQGKGEFHRGYWIQNMAITRVEGMVKDVLHKVAIQLKIF